MTVLSRTHHRFFAAMAVVCVSLIALGSDKATAVEQTERFLAELRDRGWNEIALDYLERMQTSPLASEEFKKRIPYEQGFTLLGQATRIADTAERSAKMADARAKIEAFAAANAGEDLALRGRMQIAAALVGHGRAIRDHARSLAPNQESEQSEEMSLARDALEEGHELYAELKTDYRKAYDSFPKNQNPRTDATELERRRRIGQLWLNAWLEGLITSYDQALTFSAGARERGELLKETAKQLAYLFDKYHTQPVGLTALLYEGRCHQDLGDLDEAIGCFDSIAEQDARAPAMRQLIAQALRYQAECYLQQKKYNEVIGQCGPWIEDSRVGELRTPHWLATRYHLGTAHLLSAEAAKKENDRKTHHRAARAHFKFVAGARGVFWNEAREQSAKLRGGNESTFAEAKTFDEAVDLGKDALEQMTVATTALAVARDNAPDQVASLEDDVATSRQEALRHFSRAMSLANSRTDVDALNQARGYVCYLQWVTENYWEAAVLGEFLARRYPDHSLAKNSAKIAMASYQKLYQQARQSGTPADQLVFEGRRMAEIADLIVRRWPDSQAAGDAFNGLIDFALRERRLDDAKKFLAGVAEGSRGIARLKVGSALWADYLSQLRLAESRRPPPLQLAALRDEAVSLLESGFASAGSDHIGPTLANGGLYLAQAYNQGTKYAEAIATLEREPIGPLALVEAEHDAAARPGYTSSVYRVALAAYVLASPPQREKAQRMMDALERSMGDDAEAATKLTQMYVGLGVHLQRQLEALQAADRFEELEEIAPAFEDFLGRVRDRVENADWRSRLWLARAYYNLGQSVDAGGPLSDKATAYYEKSLSAYDLLLGPESGSAPSETSGLAAIKQRADCLRRLGRFNEAIAGYADLLAQKPMMLDVQRAAAETYFEWGDRDPQKYQNAIAGGQPNEKGDNIIYGWIKIAGLAGRLAARKPKYRDVYYDGWRSVARSRHAMAVTTKGADREKQLRKAKRTIRALYFNQPELGGETSRRQFEQLLKRIQKGLKQESIGLKEFD